MQKLVDNICLKNFGNRDDCLKNKSVVYTFVYVCWCIHAVIQRTQQYPFNISIQYMSCPI